MFTRIPFLLLFMCVLLGRETKACMMTVEEGLYQFQNVGSQFGIVPTGNEIGARVTTGTYWTNTNAWYVVFASDHRGYAIVNHYSGLALSIKRSKAVQLPLNEPNASRPNDDWCFERRSNWLDEFRINDRGSSNIIMGSAHGGDVVVGRGQIDSWTKPFWLLHYMAPVFTRPSPKCKEVTICFGGTITPKQVLRDWSTLQARSTTRSIDLDDAGPFESRVTSEVQVNVTDILTRSATCTATVSIEPCAGQIQPICDNLSLCAGSDDDFITPGMIGSKSIAPGVLVASEYLNKQGPFPADTVTKVRYTIEDIKGKTYSCTAEIEVKDCDQKAQLFGAMETIEPTPAPTRYTLEPTPRPSSATPLEFAPAATTTLRPTNGFLRDAGNTDETFGPTVFVSDGDFFVTAMIPTSLPSSVPTQAPSVIQATELPTAAPTTISDCVNKITRFALIDAITDKTVSVMPEQVVESSMLTRKYMNIKAFLEICPDRRAKSVHFVLRNPDNGDLIFEYCDSRPPFSLFGDRRGNYVGRILSTSSSNASEVDITSSLPPAGTPASAPTVDDEEATIGVLSTEYTITATTYTRRFCANLRNTTYDMDGFTQLFSVVP